MGLLRQAVRASVSWGPLDERWYSSDLGGVSSGGIVISAEGILRCGTVLAAVRFLADAWGMSPPQVFRRTATGREATPDHNVQRVLRSPTLAHTGYRWRHYNMTMATTWGNAYNEIVGGIRSFAEELRPLHPSLIQVSRQLPDGMLEYEYRPQDGPMRTLSQAQVLHFRGLSTDGISGVPMYQLIRNAVGIALAAEKHVGVFLRKGARLSGMLVPSAPLEKPQRKELRDSWNQDFGGADNSGSVGVLPFGVDFKPIAADHAKSQMLELRSFQVEEILRFLGVPGVVVGYSDKTATYASAKEFFESGGIKHSILPWVTNLEAEEEKALLEDGDEHYIKHNLDVLLRANTKDRHAALFVACGRPWLTGNEVREIEDWNPITDDEGMDEVAKPPNESGDDEEEPLEPVPGSGSPALPPVPPDDDEEEEGGEGAVVLARTFVADAAAQVVRREMLAIRGSNGGKGAALRFASDPRGWRVWIADYYARHEAHVMATMHVDADVARRYCEEQASELRTGGVAAAERWTQTATPRLVAAAGGG